MYVYKEHHKKTRKNGRHLRATHTSGKPVEDEAGPPAGAVVGGLPLTPARPPLKPMFHQAFNLFRVGKWNVHVMQINLSIFSMNFIFKWGTFGVLFHDFGKTLKNKLV